MLFWVCLPKRQNWKLLYAVLGQKINWIYNSAIRWRSKLTHPSKLAFPGIDEIPMLDPVVSPAFVYKSPHRKHRCVIKWNNNQSSPSQTIPWISTLHGDINFIL